MQVSERVTVDRMVVASWLTLPEEDRKHILSRLNTLAAQPPEAWPAELEHRQFPYASFILRHILQDGEDLRVVFTRDEADGHLTVRHLYLQELVDRYFAKKTILTPC